MSLHVNIEDERLITCCRDCQERYIGCHGSCEEYQKQRALATQKRQWLREMAEATIGKNEFDKHVLNKIDNPGQKHISRK